MPIHDLVVVTTTFAMREHANEMATRVIQQRVVACAQVDGPIESFYEWDGQTCQETEWRLTMKTTRTSLTKLHSLVHAHHPYQQPQWIVLPVLEASAGYAAWVLASVAEGTG
jgi:periplasmic divalent cation tolerance protein